MELNVILYIVFSLIFALIAFGIFRYIMKNKKLDQLRGMPTNRAERRAKASPPYNGACSRGAHRSRSRSSASAPVPRGCGAREGSRSNG